jgi:hypothetical protein
MKELIKMEMINRYIYAVTEKLAPSQREDIARELHGLIQDMLDERAVDRDVTTKDIEEVLLELGDPNKLADNYRETKKFLIGPALFESYVSVLKIVLVVTAISIGISFAVQSFTNPMPILTHFIDSIISLTVGLPLSFGWVTLVFAAIEYYGQGKDVSTKERWKPTNLPVVPEHKGSIKRSGPISAIIFYILLLVLTLNTYFVQYFGIHRINEGFVTVPFLNVEVFSSYSPFIIFILSIAILKELFKLASGRWTFKLAIFNTCINIISFATIIYLITSATFWNPHFMTELAEVRIVTVGTEGFETTTKVWESVTRWTTIILIVSYLWDTIDGHMKHYKTRQK